MAIFHAIKKFFAAPPLVVRFADLEPGRVVLEGEVRADDGHLKSPLKGKPCVGFYYVATHQVPNRGNQAVRPLRSAEVFHPFALALDGGRVLARPRTPGRFGAEDHQALLATGYAGFQAEEEIIPPRARVQVNGVVRRDGDTWTITFHRLAIVGGKGGRGKKR